MVKSVLRSLRNPYQCLGKIATLYEWNGLLQFSRKRGLQLGKWVYFSSVTASHPYYMYLKSLDQIGWISLQSKKQRLWSFWLPSNLNILATGRAKSWSRWKLLPPTHLGGFLWQWGCKGRWWLAYVLVWNQDAPEEQVWSQKLQESAPLSGNTCRPWLMHVHAQCLLWAVIFKAFQLIKSISTS